MPILNGCYDAWCTGGSTNDMPGNLGVVTPKMCFQDAIDAIDAIDDVLSHKFHVCVFFFFRNPAVRSTDRSSHCSSTIHPGSFRFES